MAPRRKGRSKPADGTRAAAATTPDADRAGDRFYERYGPVAVLFTPSWVAGIHHMRWSRFLPVNAVSALIWALAFGVGAYLLGPSISDIAANTGLAGRLLLGALLVLAAVVVAWRRIHRSA